MKWFWTPNDPDIEAAKKEADQTRTYVEDAEKIAERIVEERALTDRQRAVTDLAARDNRKRWKRHLDSNGWNEIMEDQIKKAMKKRHL